MGQSSSFPSYRLVVSGTCVVLTYSSSKIPPRHVTHRLPARAQHPPSRPLSPARPLTHLSGQSQRAGQRPALSSSACPTRNTARSTSLLASRSPSTGRVSSRRSMLRALRAARRSRRGSRGGRCSVGDASDLRRIGHWSIGKTRFLFLPAL